MSGSTILGYGHYAPQRRVANAEIETRLGLEPGWIFRRTGIEERRYAADDEALTDIAVPAADMALQQSGLRRADVALTLLATSTPDHLLPPSAPLLAHRLGLSNSGGIDLAGACAGFLYALTLADSFVRVHGAPVVVAPSDRPGDGVLGAKLAADGSGYGLISIEAGGSRRPFAADLAIEETQMAIADGKAVFTRAVDMMSATSREALAKARLTVADIDFLVPHQANGRIIAAVAQQLGVHSEKVISTIAKFGNSSAATIPLTLSIAAAEGRLQRGQRLLMCAAGAGLTGGAVVYRL
jgi:3-oxoacyl-[acyl-carrier-protein] synthase III